MNTSSIPYIRSRLLQFIQIHLSQTFSKGLILHSSPIFLLIFLSSIFFGCRHSGKELQPGILLSFDDRNILNWEKQIPLFEKYNAHVTFFIDHFDKLTEDQIKALHNLKGAGHAIGCHGLRHLKAAEYSRDHSVEQYIYREILPSIQVMNENGLSPFSFAYPSSNHSNETDEALMQYFRYLRSGCGTEGSIENTDKAFMKIKDIPVKGRLDGISFHPKLKTDDLVLQVKSAMNRIKNNGELLVLYAHDIRNPDEDGPRHYISVEALEEVLSYAQKHNIRFYSFDELTNK